MSVFLTKKRRLKTEFGIIGSMIKQKSEIKDYMTLRIASAYQKKI
jgi:hypothetical protein